MSLLRFILPCVIIAFLVLPQAGNAQQDSTKTDSTKFARHAIYLEALGNGVLGSLNYDFRVWKHLSIRVAAFNAMGMVNGIIGLGNHTMELGFGRAVCDAVLTQRGIRGTYYYWTGTIAYRYQPRDGGLFFRIGMTPLFDDFGTERLRIRIGSESYITFWGGASFGYTF